MLTVVYLLMCLLTVSIYDCVVFCREALSDQSASRVGNVSNAKEKD